MSFHVYLLKNSVGRRYIGVTSNMSRRLEMHNSGLSKWTKHKGPWEVIWLSYSLDKSQAFQLEKLMKKQKGGKGLVTLMDVYKLI